MASASRSLMLSSRSAGDLTARVFAIGKAPSCGQRAIASMSTPILPSKSLSRMGASLMLQCRQQRTHFHLQSTSHNVSLASSSHYQLRLNKRTFSTSSAKQLFSRNGEGRPRKRFRALRWMFRLSLLSALLGLGYVGYGIYLSRSPAEQLEPDPNKKTLVVLGISANYNMKHRAMTAD